VNHQHLAAIVRAGTAGVDPARLVVNACAPLDWTRTAPRIHLLSVGKAARAMALAANTVFGGRLVSALVVIPSGEAPTSDLLFETIVGGHPLPTADSERAGRSALRLAESVRPGERFVCLLSGGASALMAGPAPGITLADKKATTDSLLRAGADITATNTVRKHLSEIKGGGLVRRSVTGCHTLAISDVVGDDPAVIGSGPGVVDNTTCRDALETLQKFGGLGVYPAGVVDLLRAGTRGDRQETLKSSDPAALLATCTVVGGRNHAMVAACEAAERLGYRTVRFDEPVVGEARLAARALVEKIRGRCRHLPRPWCVVSSGETTVNVSGAGRGGRNQEFALAVVRELNALGPGVAMASVGTDGIDGPTDAAGAFVDATSLDRAERLALSPEEFMERNDSYGFFGALGDLFMTGRTGTNVGDLQVVLASHTP